MTEPHFHTYAAWAEEAALIAEACLLAGRAESIPRLLRTVTLEDCERLLAAEAGPQSARPQPPATGAITAPVTDDLARVGAERLAAQSRRYD